MNLRSAVFSAPQAAITVLLLASCAHLDAPATAPAAEEGESSAVVRIDKPILQVILPEDGAAAAPELPPSTDIFLVDFDVEAVPWRVLDVERATDRDGYDNQPYFDGDDILYTSMRNGQTDIFRYEVETAEVRQLTATEESEYSPTPIPDWPGFSAVRVEADGTQRLWRFPRSPGAGRGPEAIFESIAPVGYHAWIEPEAVALFVLGEPHRLVVADPSSEDARTLASDIGRALHAVPGRAAVSFVDKSDAEAWRVAMIDLATGDRREIVETPPGSEDFVWWSSRELLIGSESKLFLFDLDGGDGWRQVADLASDGIQGITRLAHSLGTARLAVVAERHED